MKRLTSNIIKLSLIVFFLLGLGFAGAKSSMAATYFVDGIAGDDGGAGTVDSPWKTINQALKHARESDVIYIRYAVYNETINLAPIPLRGISLIGIPQEGNRPVIHSSSPNKDTIFLVNFTGVIKGLDITGATDAIGINCVANDGVNVAEISDCYIYGNSMGIHATTVGTNPSECSPMIHHNYIFSNSARGIGNMGHATPTIAYNVIYENGSGGMGEGGIGVTNEAKPKIIGNLIFNNNDAGISMNSLASPEIVNNTIYGNNGNTPISAGIRCGQDDAITSVKIENNIIVNNARGI
ncbi:MAG: right-handed parallel beta-helix repeat-containing protein, partial [Thermodesulfobacteria bacterium]|nr:right-handed parallel beta-helix repeat-containing protein [Thermodesulfobacteriota bacterium]